MNFVEYGTLSVRMLKTYIVFLLFSIFLICLAGCSDQVQLPSSQKLAEFENAGIPSTISDTTAPANQSGIRSYRVIPGNVIELTIPAIIQAVTKEEADKAITVTQSLYRVSEKGTITLPVVGEIEVAGKTLAQIESTIQETYYPKYTSIRPTIFAQLSEKPEPPLFSVMGLVNKPGNFPYPSNIQYNLMQALAFAGGLDRTAEPHYATVYRLKQDGKIISAIFEVENIGKNSKLPITLNTHIKPGDIILVEHTPRTRTNEFLKGIFRINVGTYFNLDDIWED